MVIRLLKDEPVAFKAETQGTQIIFRARFAHGANVSMIFARSLPFSICVEDTHGGETNTPVTSDFFGGLIRDILRFYETGTPSFETSETVNVMRLREGVLKALETPDVWVR